MEGTSSTGLSQEEEGGMPPPTSEADQEHVKRADLLFVTYFIFRGRGVGVVVYFNVSDFRNAGARHDAVDTG